MTIFRHRSYLQKQRFLPRLIEAPPEPALGLVVVIPCHAEPDLLATLDSLEACEAPPCAVEVLVVLNAGEHAPASILAQNQATQAAFQAWQQQATRRYRYHLLCPPPLPRKHAGVGLARKIGLDEAVDRLEQAGQPQGVLVCLDADATVAPNYLQALHQVFRDQPKLEAVSLHFEHPLAGDAFPPAVYAGILRYELYLRYYIEGLRFAGFPYAYHAVGSSLAVRSPAYQAVGGMNRRKAGEDFYFLHKLMPRERVGTLGTTTVFPSPRPSERVPFGTGKAINRWLEAPEAAYPVYHPHIFADLKAWLVQVPDLYDQAPAALPESVGSFLAAEGFDRLLPELRANVRDAQAFPKRFFQWFDGLKVLQFVHHAQAFHPDQPLLTALSGWAELAGLAGPAEGDLRAWLDFLREREVRAGGIGCRV